MGIPIEKPLSAAHSLAACYEQMKWITRISDRLVTATTLDACDPCCLTSCSLPSQPTALITMHPQLRDWCEVHVPASGDPKREVRCAVRCVVCWRLSVLDMPVVIEAGQRSSSQVTSAAGAAGGGHRCGAAWCRPGVSLAAAIAGAGGGGVPGGDRHGRWYRAPPGGAPAHPPPGFPSPPPPPERSPPKRAAANCLPAAVFLFSTCTSPSPALSMMHDLSRPAKPRPCRCRFGSFVHERPSPTGNDRTG